MNARKPTLAVFGATGAVGTVMLSILSQRSDVWGEIRLIASARSAGKVLQVRGEDIVVQEITPRPLTGSTSPCSTCPMRSRRTGPLSRCRTGRGGRQLRRLPDGSRGSAGRA